ncbi:MAG: type II toxin-antitoxin system HipA family toxin YjjJ [Betaproteobacteria bacterium]|nr:type II toxin-antitoxin system HipA family toxin YjjJ [Betaproteobacteria bacterium]
MASHADQLRLHLAREPLTSRQLVEKLELSQPTISRTLLSLREEIVRIGSGPSIQYALRDTSRGLREIPVYRVSAEGSLQALGVLVPVHPEGFVIRQADGRTLHSAGLPWWVLDMCPQGFLGRAYARRHAASLGLPPKLDEWSDTDMLRALLAHGDDAVGNLLLGDTARTRVLESPPPVAIDPESGYPALADAAERGELPGSSAGGEQPKFTAFTGCHVLVKFTSSDVNPVSLRWRDLLAAEHVAAKVLRNAGIPASSTRLIDTDGRRFLEVERFDRVGLSGRRALHSLSALEAEFVGAATLPWPVLAARLAQSGVVTPQAVAGAEALFAFGTLIGNSDMHNGNISFMSEHGRPYSLAPAYDMLPMALAPSHAGSLPGSLPAPRLHPGISPETWRRALDLAQRFIGDMSSSPDFSADWEGCARALQAHVAQARTMISRLI